MKFVWQVSHCRVVGTWLTGLPSAVTPWQSAQRPVTGVAAARCSKVAVAQVVVDLWQVSHCAVVATCVAGLVCAFWLTKPPLWQVVQLAADTGPAIFACSVATSTVIGAKLEPAA